MKVNIPGLRNSNEGHWQTHLERIQPLEFIRINQDDWDSPDCESWITKIEQELKNQNYSELILIGHSIGCIAIIKWFEKFQHKIKGALLVAPSDAEKDNYPTYITGFTPIPLSKLPFPTIVVASSNDHVSSLERTIEFAECWGSKHITLENAGHIEPSSGFGKWDMAFALIDQLEKQP